MSFRKIANKILGNFGYQITKIDYFKLLLEKIYNKNFHFIQVGANDGIKFDELYWFVTSHQCKGLVIEPISFYFEKLAKNYSDYPDIIAVKTAIHKSEKNASIHFPDPKRLNNLPDWSQGIGSLNPGHHRAINIPSSHMTTEEVKCMHLMELIEKFDFYTVDLIQIDVEGYDAEVVKMIDFNKIRPKLIKFEHKSLDNYTKNEVNKLLKSEGYKIIPQGEDTLAYLG